MDRSYYTSFELQFEENVKQHVAPLLRRLKLQDPSEFPFFKTANLCARDNSLIAPVDLLHLGDKVFLTVHPSAAEEVNSEL